MQSIFKACALILATTFFLAACGQKGPLFLPGNPSEIRSIPPTEPADEDEEDDEEPANVPR